RCVSLISEQEAHSSADKSAMPMSLARIRRAHSASLIPDLQAASSLSSFAFIDANAAKLCRLPSASLELLTKSELELLQIEARKLVKTRRNRVCGALSVRTL